MLYMGKDIYGGIENNNNSDRKNYSSIDIRFFGIVLFKCNILYIIFIKIKSKYKLIKLIKNSLNIYI